MYIRIHTCRSLPVPLLHWCKPQVSCFRLQYATFSYTKVKAGDMSSVLYQDLNGPLIDHCFHGSSYGAASPHGPVTQ